MRVDLSIYAQAIWLALRDEGGWWSIQEAAEHIANGHDQISLHGARISAGKGLPLLERLGHIKRNPCDIGGRPATFGVTEKCWPIDGYTLQPGSPKLSRPTQGQQP